MLFIITINLIMILTKSIIMYYRIDDYGNLNSSVQFEDNSILLTSVFNCQKSIKIY